MRLNPTWGWRAAGVLIFGGGLAAFAFSLISIFILAGLGIGAFLVVEYGEAEA